MMPVSATAGTMPRKPVMYQRAAMCQDPRMKRQVRTPAASWQTICSSPTPCMNMLNPPSRPVKEMARQMSCTAHAASTLASAACSSAVVGLPATETATLSACAGRRTAEAHPTKRSAAGDPLRQCKRGHQPGAGPRLARCWPDEQNGALTLWKYTSSVAIRVPTVSMKRSGTMISAVLGGIMAAYLARGPHRCARAAVSRRRRGRRLRSSAGSARELSSGKFP